MTTAEKWRQVSTRRASEAHNARNWRLKWLWRQVGEVRMKSDAPEVALLALNNYCLQSCASGIERAARLQWVLRP